MIHWSDEQLAEAGIDKARLRTLMRKLNECGKEMTAMGLHLYGESGDGNLIHDSRPTHDDRKRADLDSVVASTGAGRWDGGGW